MLVKQKNPYFILLLISIVGLYIAYVVEYVIGLAACPLCIYQRFPYLIFIMLSIITLSSENPKKYNIYFIITAFLAIVIAGYHTGVEHGIFEMSAFCKPLISITNNLSVSDFRKLLYNQPIAMCNKPALVIFGLSMTEWNLLLNLIIFITLVIYRNYNTQYNA